MNYEFRKGSYRHSICNCLFFCLFLPMYFIGMYVALSCKILYSSLSFVYNISFVFEFIVLLLPIVILFSRLFLPLRIVGSISLIIASFYCGFSFFVQIKGICVYSSFVYAVLPFLIPLLLLVLLSHSYTYARHFHQSVKDYIFQNPFSLLGDLFLYALFVVFLFNSL